ncbi:double-transmembrane region domain protein [Allomuricauda ruestringensis DSM 13258]|uniref:Double-transmembrane region domain protein n=1 Tax=Allomuricauda ruestringensis (strain DSM 13258 / CIP 107369 / LMG 19739 / B1) TaxID=886377 RepID=G2PJ65_ALLRU|nr:BatA domain-containing protein [Allomuricauda ruestringensis]AEM71886.1 double-transmembrane region domain protein [Allomuricauda ruestringensis DSM 13258]
MVFANPSYLWALLGLLVPLAIHLWSKKEAKIIKIGSIQLLDESNSRQSSSIQLNEWLLLLLRMLIVALVVLLMAGPQWRTKGNQKQITYLVETSIANEVSISSVLDSLQEDSPVFLLKNGFPEWEDDADYQSDKEQPNYWQLVQKMDSLRSDSIVVFTKALVKGIKSMRPNTQKKIHWVVVDSEETQDQPLLAVKQESAVELITASSTGRATKINKELLEEGFNISNDSLRLLSEEPQTVPLKKLDTLRINLYVEDDFEREGKYIEASFRALSAFLKREIVIHKEDEPTSDQANLNIWLSNEPKNNLEGKWLVHQENPLAKQLIELSPRENFFYLTSKLNPKNTVDQHLPEQLLNILALDKDLKGLVTKMDVRQMDEAELKPNYVEPKRKRESATLLDVSLWVFAILAGLMIVERLLSNYKKQ